MGRRQQSCHGTLSGRRLTMFIWLKDGAGEKLADLKKQGLLGDVKVETNRDTGKKYVPIYGDVFDPAAAVPIIPTDLIERVTLQDRIHRGLRTEGVYRHDGAELVLKTDISFNSGPFDEEDREYQNVNVSAPSVKLLKEIYTLVRQGKLAPEENWEAPILTTPSATKPADGTAA